MYQPNGDVSSSVDSVNGSLTREYDPVKGRPG